MSLRALVGVGAGILAMPVAALAQGGAGDAATNWGAIAECGSIDNAARRHDCVDGVLRRAGVLSEARVAQAAREDFGNERRAATPERAPAPLAPTAPPTRAADIEELVTTVASVASAGYNRLRVTTAEGSVWEQTQAEAFRTPPKPGDSFTIERGAVGSFRCQFGRASLYRCQRVD